MVGAVLTIAGYSINDTIVVYDRIREGLASGRKGSIEQIMNESINQTLSRTILTSTVTLIPILCLAHCPVVDPRPRREQNQPPTRNYFQTNQAGDRELALVQGGALTETARPRRAGRYGPVF